MPGSPIDSFEAMLAAGREGTMLRFGLGNEYLKLGEPARAAIHLRRAVELDPRYSAAWKLLGRALVEADDVAGAIAAYQSGIAAAEAKGDLQAMKEMRVFLRRLQRPAVERGSAPGDDESP